MECHITKSLQMILPEASAKSDKTLPASEESHALIIVIRDTPFMKEIWEVFFLATIHRSKTSRRPDPS